jgi:hypothetical protein
MAAIPEYERCLPLDTSEEVRKTISAAFPGTDWSDARWGIYDALFGSVEFNLGDEEPAEGILIHIRSSKSVLAPIIQFCQQREWQVLDISSGLFLDRTPAGATFSMERMPDVEYPLPDHGAV